MTKHKKHHLPPLPAKIPKKGVKLKDLNKKFQEKKAREEKHEETPKQETPPVPKKRSMKQRLHGFFFKPEKPKNAKETEKHPEPSAEKPSEVPEIAKVAEKPKEEDASEKLKEDNKKAPETTSVEKPGKTPPEKKTPDTKKVVGKSKKEDAKKRAEQIVKKMRTQPLKKPQRKKLKRKSLQEYLGKAGYEIEAEKLKHRLFKIMLGIFLVITVYFIYEAVTWGTQKQWEHFGRFLLFLFGLWTVLFVAACLFLMGAVYFFLDYKVYKRTREVEDVLPDFLQLASANIAAGMPIDRALWYSIRPNFGVLAKEMEEVAKATMSGEDLESSLQQFTERYDSLLLKRSINILIEGLHSGGELADLLNKIALNIDELKIMRKEMAANVTTYAIFIIIAAVAIAPALFALATQLLTIIVEITGSLDLSSTSSLFTLSAVDAKIVDDFVLFSYLMLIVSSTFGSMIVSIIQKGNVLNGIKSIPAYALVAIVIYKIASILLGGLFGGIV